jgi:hypothetical protein
VRIVQSHICSGTLNLDGRLWFVYERSQIRFQEIGAYMPVDLSRQELELNELRLTVKGISSPHMTK